MLSSLFDSPCVGVAYSYDGILRYISMTFQGLRPTEAGVIPMSRRETSLGRDFSQSHSCL